MSKRCDHIGDVLAPFLLAVSFEPAQANVILICTAFPVPQVREFHWHKNAVRNQRGTKTGAESQKQHATAFVTSNGLHRGVIDHFNRTAEGFFKVETHPSITEILGFCRRPTVQDGSRIPKRDDFVRPIGGESLDLLHHLPRSHVWTRRDLARYAFPGRKNFEISPPTSTTSTLRKRREIRPSLFRRCFTIFSPNIGCVNEGAVPRKAHAAGCVRKTDRIDRSEF